MPQNESPGELAGSHGAVAQVLDRIEAIPELGDWQAPSRRPTPRPYQTDLVDRIEAKIAAQCRRCLLVLGTGGGKTIIIAELIARAVAKGQRVLFVANHRELIEQAAAKLYDVGIDAGIIMAEHPTRPGEPVQVASIATLYARAFRHRSIELPPADIVVVDEAHHITARTYTRIIEAYPNAVILGATATPCRGDGRGLGGHFDALVEGPPIADLTRDGYLVPTRVYAPTRPDLSGIDVQRGDYVEKQLAERMNTQQLVGDIVTHWHRLAERRPTVVFASGVAHSVHLCDQFGGAGVMAAHLDGTTPAAEREAILKRLAAGQVEVVCNAAVLTEGWDSPTVSCLVLARPTKSIVLYRQVIGRVLRPAPGKTDALILDHAGATFCHGLIEDPIEWTLQPDQRAENKAQQRRESGRAPTLTTCPECSGIRLAGQPCTVCGWRPRAKPKAVDVADGDLAAVDRNRRSQPITVSAQQQRDFHRQLSWIAGERGYQRGWAANKFKEKFGAWPNDRSVEPMEPTPETRAWVKSRQIAFAKSRDRRGAA